MQVLSSQNLCMHAIVVENTGTKDVTINHIEVNHLGITNTDVDPEPEFVFKTTDTAKNNNGNVHLHKWKRLRHCSSNSKRP